MKKAVALVLALSLTVGCGRTPSNNQMNYVRMIALASYPLLVSQAGGFSPEQIPVLLNAAVASGALGPEAAAILADPKNQQLLTDIFTLIQGGSGQQAALAGVTNFGDPAQVAQTVSLILSVLQVAGPSLGVTISPEMMVTISLITTMLPVVIQLVNSMPAPRRA